MDNCSLDFDNSSYVEDEECPDAFEFVVYGVLLNLIGIMGIVGNALSMVILSRPQMKSSINYLLIGLARCDIVLIVTSMLLFGLPAIYSFTRVEMLFYYKYMIHPYLSQVVYPVATIAQTVSVYLTLTVTLERFVAVCHPLRARSLCTYGRARLYVILIIVFSTLYNLIKFWEIDVCPFWSYSRNMTLYEVRASDLRTNKIYVSVYIHWLYMIFIYFLPFSCLALLNGTIYRQVRRANAERQRMSRVQKREIGLATMLLCVVVVFVLCNLLPLVTNVLENFYGIIWDSVIKIGNLLVTFNSSVNFVIYVTFGEKFKRLFLKIFCAHGGWCSGHGGRDSPDGATHDDSLISNGDGRTYSVRGAHLCQLHRSGTTVVRSNGHHSHSARNKQAHRSMRVARTLSPGPCVYYPARQEHWEPEVTTTSTVNQL